MKIVIIGIVASGKTTLSKRLSKQKEIPCYEMDSIVHDDINNIKRSLKEQKNIIMDICKNNNDWIIEGTLRKNMDFVLDIADRIIYIDIPLRLRKRRILIRYIKQKLGIERCNYKPSLKMVKMMYKWTYDFEKEKHLVTEKLRKYKDKIIVLDTVKKVSNYNVTIE